MLILLFGLLSVRAAMAAPPQWITNGFNVVMTAGTTHCDDLSTMLANPSSDITFTIVGAVPSWLTLSSNGQLCANPPTSAVGHYTLQVIASSGSDAGSLLPINIEVVANPSGATCPDGSAATEVGLTPDHKYMLFACPNK